MNRSTINKLLIEAEEFFSDHHFYLPEFSRFSVEDWKTAKASNSYHEILDTKLGWDITDFGTDDFFHTGLILFTIRNGILQSPRYPKLYAEKIMMVREEQYTPMHFHWKKSEDIINRGGGNLLFHCFLSQPDETQSREPFTLSIDGKNTEVSPGECIALRPGESLTLLPGMYHTFYAEKGTGPVLAGEISTVNDDTSDNRFNPPRGRFPSINEDTAPYRLLVSDYSNWL